MTRAASNCDLPTLASAQQHPGRALLPLLQRLVRGICPSPDASEKLQAWHTSTAVASGARTPAQASGAKASLMAREVFWGTSLTVPASLAGTAEMPPAILA